MQNKKRPIFKKKTFLKNLNSITSILLILNTCNVVRPFLNLQIVTFFHLFTEFTVYELWMKNCGLHKILGNIWYSFTPRNWINESCDYSQKNLGKQRLKSIYDRELHTWGPKNIKLVVSFDFCQIFWMITFILLGPREQCLRSKNILWEIHMIA